MPVSSYDESLPFCVYGPLLLLVTILVVGWVVGCIREHLRQQDRMIELLAEIRDAQRGKPEPGNPPPVYCPKCEYPSPSESARCSYCGYKLDSS